MKVTNKHVLFWGGIFSNFEPAPFLSGYYKFPTSEHFFMYSKALYFGDIDTANEILYVEHPRDAKAWGRKVKNFDADEWKKVCRDVMKEGLRMKFGQRPELLKELLKYPNLKFVECSPYDKIWGIGLSEDDPNADDESKWLGTNWLGECLDTVRDEFLKKQ